MTATNLWPLALLIALLVGAVFGGWGFGVLLLLWGLVALVAQLRVYGGAGSWRSLLGDWRLLVFYALLAGPVLIAGRLDISAALLPPLAALLLASLLNRQDTAASSRNWATWVGWGIWALVGVVSLGLLSNFRDPSLAVAVLLVSLIGYNVARRALLIQQRRPIFVHGASVIVGALGATIIAHSDESLIYVFAVVIGLQLFYASDSILPDVPADTNPNQISGALLVLQSQMICVGPVMLAFLWVTQFAPV